MDLADKIIEANEAINRGYDVDELGLGIADTTDYIAARALYRNTLERKKDPSVGLLHNRRNGTELWKGNTQLNKSRKTIYELAAPKRFIKDYEIEIIWDSLLRNTPELIETKIIIDEHTYWDLELGELCFSEERMLGV